MAPAWFETLDDDLWLRPDEGGEHEAKFIHSALRLREGQLVLDAPCGAGRVAIPLARKGIQVIGIDLRESFISRAQARGRSKDLPVEFRVADLRSVAFTQRFQGVFSWFNSFGYFSDRANEDLLMRYAGALSPGGRLMIDQLNRERILRNFKPKSVNAGVEYQSRWDSSSERIFLRRKVRGIQNSRNASSQRWYTPAQMHNLMKRAGLQIEQVYGSIDGEPYHRGSHQMITIAQKPA